MINQADTRYRLINRPVDSVQKYRKLDLLALYAIEQSLQSSLQQLPHRVAWLGKSRLLRNAILIGRNLLQLTMDGINDLKKLI